MIIYKLWNPKDLWVVLCDSTKESVMILFIIAAAGVFSYMLSSLFITQSIAEWIGTLDVNCWVLMGVVNVFPLIAGFFLPPVAVILMAAPILLPIIIAAGFDPIWFAVVLTINMEIGLISPPVGLNLYVINGIAPEISLKIILTGSLPYWIVSNVWTPRCLAAMILCGSAVHLNGLASLSLYSVMKRLIAA